MTLRRALLGGTFDPPHIGHLAIAQAAWEQLGVDIVTFLPAGQPWQKSNEREVSPAAVRCEMVVAAIEGIPYFEIDRREAEREGPTYTWDTIASFDGDDVVLVLGADSAARVDTWYRSRELVERTKIAVVGRPGTRGADVEAVLGPDVRWLDMPSLDLSSTDLRRLVARGYAGRFLIPDAVREVIAGHGLYSDETQQ